MKTNYIKRLKKGWIPDLNKAINVEWDRDKKDFVETILNKKLIEAIEEVYSPLYHHFKNIESTDKRFLLRMIFNNPNFANTIKKELGIDIGREDYSKKPVRERRDNQNPVTETINFGNGYSFKSKIRVPSKKHKNRYKNFLKLFPNFKTK